MHKKLPIFYSALLLTCVNLLLRLIGTSFHVYITGRIGATGVGLLQLVMSVGGFAMVAGMAGIRTASMYLTAEELGKKQVGNTRWILSGCFLYSIVCSGLVAGLLYVLSPEIAENWIGDIRTLKPLQLYAAMVPVFCLCGVMTGYFTAINRIGTLAMVEVAEQLCSMGITTLALMFWTGDDPGRACQSIILGSGFGACLTLLCLTVLRIRENTPKTQPVPVCRRLAQTAVPLALADIVKAGISTTENLMVPRRLTKYPLVSDPIGAFGVVSGMVFPILMFPACILFALAELLIPELARCNASGSKNRISYLVRRSLKIAMVYGLLFGGLMFLFSEPLCRKLYQNPEAAKYLKLYSLLIPMLYSDAITDAMTKGLGQQKICVRYNIITSALDVILLFVLLPRYGMEGYFASFLVTHLINFALSLHRLLSITGEALPFYIPALGSAACVAAVYGASLIRGIPGQGLAYIALLGSLLYLFGIMKKEDLLWLKGILRTKK